jgi:ubiquinone/menaquinone biosynthesis C-methylase UbiE
MSQLQEVERIRQMYASRDVDPTVAEMWAPFAGDEVDYRSQQYWCLATLMRGTGRSSLAGLKILDVGCGKGRFLRACLDMGASPENLFGVDLYSRAIDEARELSPHLHFQASNGTDLDFPDGKFDLLTQFVAFSSIFNDKLRTRLASEMIRVLKPGGYIFWWDLMQTVERSSQDQLRPQELFPGMKYQQLVAGLRPKPQSTVLLPRVLRPFARILDKFAYPPTHIAALIGPKQ